MFLRKEMSFNKALQDCLEDVKRGLSGSNDSREVLNNLEGEIKKFEDLIRSCITPIIENTDTTKLSLQYFDIRPNTNKQAVAEGLITLIRNGEVIFSATLGRYFKGFYNEDRYETKVKFF